MSNSIPEKMVAVQLTGHGGFEKLVYREDVPVPSAGPGEVLVRIGAAGVNNTDINTRIGWYSKTVTYGTTSDGGSGGFEEASDEDATWGGAPLQFPRIQGIDGAGTIVAVGEGVDPSRVGERVLVDPCLREPAGNHRYYSWFYGSECDGAFAQFSVAPSVHTHKVESDLSDEELASFPCSYSTAENMLTRSKVAAGDRVLVTGASGGVGSAAVQLAKRRGAEVVAVCGLAKADEVKAAGAAEVISRDADLLAALGTESVDVVVDLVAGPSWPSLLEILKRGGRYAVAGAIAGPMVELDVRTLYLKDLSFFGCTVLEPEVFPNLVGYIERGEIKPLVAKTYPLSEIAQAQQDFLEKKHTGKLVLVPPKA